jgi:hypothetical protein
MLRIKTLLLLCGLIGLNLLSAQPYVEGGQTRHRFAQLTLGGDLLYTPAAGQLSYLGEDEGVEATFPATLTPRLMVGGTHFWGHVDFYVAFSLLNLLPEAVGPGAELSRHPGIETGLKLYPWRIERDRVVPFVGAALGTPRLQLTQDGAKGASQGSDLVVFNGGLTYQRGNLILEAGARYAPHAKENYALSRDQFSSFTLPRWSSYLSARWTLETTLSAEEPYQDGRIEAQKQRMLANGQLSGWSVAVGPSSSFVLGAKRSTYNDGERAFLANHSGSGVFPDFGLGYYHYPWDAHVNLAYRSYRSRVSAYDFEQTVRRRALTLEAYKFLGDYHGFVPFIGPAVSLEQWTLKDQDGGATVYEQREEHVLPAITFGWDIRPTETQSLILRTNLRYTPFRLHTPDEGFLFMHQLEFNFIQVVIYPGRW